MTRRWALASALFLTATFGFLVVALGSQAGVFAWGRGADATTDAAAVASPTPNPRIITEYVVVDPTPSADASAPADGAAPASEAGEPESQHEDAEHDGEHHDDDHHDADHEEHEEHDD